MPKTVHEPVVQRSRTTGRNFISGLAVWFLIGFFIALDRHMFRAIYTSSAPFINFGPLVRFVVVVLLGPLNPFMGLLLGILNSIPTR